MSRPRPYLMAFIYALVVSGVYSIETSLFHVGLALGFVGAHLLAGAMSRLLFEVNATDPPTFLAMSLMLAGVAAAASFLPARRITAVDPMIALRST